MDISTKTATDAYTRVIHARSGYLQPHIGQDGSMVPPSDEYLEKLRSEIAAWLESVNSVIRRRERGLCI